MAKLHYSTLINAPKEKVWHVMLDDVTFREWTSVFNPGGSYFEGEWKTGSDIKFLGPDKDGQMGGMISRIKEARPFDFVSIIHRGEINKGVQKMYESGEDFYENYTLNEKGEGTELLVDMSVPDEMKDMFSGMWPSALEKLKQMCES